MSRNRPLFTLRASVRTALAEAGDKGVTLQDLQTATGADRREIQRALGALGEMGEKFAAPITSKLWRHFATEAQRDAWVKRKAPARVALSPEELRSIQIHAAKVRGAKAAPPPLGKRTTGVPGAALVVPGGTISPPAPRMPRPAADPIFTEKTVETRDTTVRPTAKWQMQQLPPDPRYPSFSSTPFGVNPDTGKAWGARA